MFHGGNPEVVVDRPISGGYVSRDYPFREIGIGDSGVPLTRGRALALTNPDGRESVVMWEEVILTKA
jgi:hypothetical protein